MVYISLVLIVVLLFLFKQEKERNFPIKLSYGLILGGALSNFVDRVLYGYVIDYIDLKVWPVFNLADTSICIGVGYILINSLFKKSKRRYKILNLGWKDR